MNESNDRDELLRGRNERETTVWRFLVAVFELLEWRFVGLVLLTLVIGLISGVSLVLLMPMLQVVGLDVSGGTGERFVEAVFGVLATVGLEPTLPTVLTLNGVAVVATALLSRYQSLVAIQANQTVVQLLRRRLYASICRANWLYIAGERTTRLNHVLLGELDRVGGAVSSLVSLLVGGGRALAYAVIALVLSPAMTALTMLCGIALSLLLLRRTRLGRTAGSAVSTAYGDLYTAAGEHLAGLKFTKSHALEERQASAFDRITAKVAMTHVEVVRNQADVSLFLQTGTVAALSLIIYFAFEVFALPLATVLLLIYLFSRLLPMLASVQRSYQSLIGQLPAFAQYEETLDRSERAAEPLADERIKVRLERAIELRGVGFGYHGTEGRPALGNLHLAIEAGKTTAIVGASGAGKSTIADLVTGLLEPDTGALLIDGLPLDARRRRAWRKGLAYVSQDVFLFHDTIRANLSMARPGASEEELREALEAASAGFVWRLPEGLDTVVGDRGMRLSGGERQRLVLARALLRNPELLVLDEATSSLDADNEERVKEAIDRLSGRMTILVIAHRLASIRSAHVIHLIDEGRLVESGGWEELMRLENGQFRGLALTQGLSEAVSTGDRSLATASD